MAVSRVRGPNDAKSKPRRTTAGAHSIPGSSQQRGGNFGAGAWRSQFKVAQSRSSERPGDVAMVAKVIEPLGFSLLESVWL
jgi:hypothetical protein